MTSVLLRRGEATETDGVVKTEAETEVTCHRLRSTRTAIDRRKLRQRHGMDSPSEPPRGTSPANTLILDFWLQNYE